MCLPLRGRYENEYGLLLVGTNIIVTPVPLLFGILVPMGCNTCIYFTLCCRRSQRHLDEVQEVDITPTKEKYKLEDAGNGAEQPGVNMASRVLEVMRPIDASHVEDVTDADPSATHEEMTITEAKELMVAQERSNMELQRKLSEAEHKATRLESILQREQKKMKQLQAAGRHSLGDMSAEASAPLNSDSLDQEAHSEIGNTPSALVPRLALDDASQQRRRSRGRPRIGALAAAKQKAQSDTTGTTNSAQASVAKSSTPSGTAQETRQRVGV
eukprot:COSAG02_NODE_27_length_51735_cov_86.076749_26_plen_271_part_00